jgi:methyltransferase (TIGR00027 family)
MQTGKASQTAFSVALRRAAHQQADCPPVLVDPFAARLVGGATPRQWRRAQHRVAQDFRCFLAARARFAEDRLAQGVARGIDQYILLGAGLDTFALRNPYAQLRVFEVDHPATQQWKRELLTEAGLAVPDSQTFVPVDFERQTLTEGLAQSGFDFARPAFVSWLGVVPYLTIEAFRTTIACVAAMVPGTAICFDYNFPPETLTSARQKIFSRLAARVAAAGEPFRLFFRPEQLEAELDQVGLGRVEQTTTADLNRFYFAGRADGLRLSQREMGALVVAWR